MRTAMDRLLTLVAKHHSILPPELIHAALELGMAINRHALLTAPAATLPPGPTHGVLNSANGGQRSRLSAVRSLAPRPLSARASFLMEGTPVGMGEIP